MCRQADSVTVFWTAVAATTTLATEKKQTNEQTKNLKEIQVHAGQALRIWHKERFLA